MLNNRCGSETIMEDELNRSFVIHVGGADGVEKMVVSVRVVMRRIGQRYGIGKSSGVDRRGSRLEGGRVSREQLTTYGLGL
jgi:hypothetical protein